MVQKSEVPDRRFIETLIGATVLFFCVAFGLWYMLFRYERHSGTYCDSSWNMLYTWEDGGLLRYFKYGVFYFPDPKLHGVAWNNDLSYGPRGVFWKGTRLNGILSGRARFIVITPVGKVEALSIPDEFFVAGCRDGPYSKPDFAKIAGDASLRAKILEPMHGRALGEREGSSEDTR